MCKKLICLASLVSVVGLVLSSAANAADPTLVGWWKFEEAGGTLYDSSDNHNDGIYNGILYQQPGKEGHALGFDGRDDTIAVGSTNRPSDTFSFGGWLKTTATHELDAESTSGTAGVNGQRYAFYGRNGGSNAESGLSVGTNGISVYEHGGGYMPAIAAYVADIGTDWNHVMVVYDNKQPTIYLNGEAVHTGLASPRPLVLAPVHLGGLTYGYFEGRMDEVMIYSRVLTQKEIQSMLGGYGAALDPSPEDQATDLPRDVVLNWTPGKFADKHDVYFGTSFDDVNDATNLDPMGPDNVYRARQGVDSYVVPETLDLGRTYYWRIDEVNAPPTSHVVFKGDVWSFTVEPFAYPMLSDDIIATASSSFNAITGPENTVNGSGLDADDLHSIEQADMWLTGVGAQPPIWIQYEFDKVYKLYEMWIWNFNQAFEVVVGFGFKDVRIEYSVNGTDWTELAGALEFAQATSAPGYAHNTTVDFGGVTAKYVKITANDNWGTLNQYGLSEVRFLYAPVQAREPNPDSGATDVSVDATLGFRAGREAAQHDVYLSTDEQAVIDGTAPVTTVSQTSHGPLSLDIGQTYYWKVNEVNMAETPTTREGDIWNFATPEFLIVEDFEDYSDYEPDRIFDTWIDGWGVPTNGSTAGYTDPIFAQGEHFVETNILHGDMQSMPLLYDNAGGAAYSEAERTLSPPQDWTKHGVQALSLWFYGDPNNSPVQMYVKVNGVEAAYDGDAGNLTLGAWQAWNIDLASFGTNLQNVTKLAIGFTGGGSGLVFFDDIRLYPYGRQLVTPVEPDPANLAAHWRLDGNLNDSSGNGRHGTAMGNPTFVAGKIGQAISLDGMGDYVNITGYKGISGAQAFTLAAWIKTAADGEIVTWGTDAGTQRLSFRVDTVLRVEHGSGNVRGTNGPDLRDNQWHHVTAAVAENIAIEDVLLYVDGVDVTPFAQDPDVFDLGSETDVSIGRRATHDDRYFNGQIDDVRVYNRALSYAEVAGLAGLTVPFDKPF